MCAGASHLSSTHTAMAQCTVMPSLGPACSPHAAKDPTHRRQKASVPKWRSMVASSAFARGRRSGTCPTSKFFM